MNASGSPSAIAVDPVSVMPEFLPGMACEGYRPFATRLKVVFPPYGYGRYVNAISFAYLDQRGVRVVPLATPGSVQGGITSTGIPTNGPILVPGKVSSIFFVYPSSPAVAPYALRFRCGYAPKGMLSVRLDMVDQLGVPAHAQLAIRVGE